MNNINQNISPWIYPGFKDYTSKEAAKPEEVIQVVCDSFGVTYEHLKTRSRGKMPIPVIRQITFNMLYKFTLLNLSRIGMYFNRDYSTVIYANKCVNNMKFTRDGQFFETIINIETSLSEKYIKYERLEN